MQIKKYYFIAILLLAAPFSYANPIQIESWETSKGTKVLFVPSNHLPMVDFQISFRAGSAYDGALHGLAELTNNSLNAGAGAMNVNQIAENFDQAGAIYTNSVTRLSSNIHLRSLIAPEPFRKALDTYVAILSHPTFPVNEINKLRVQQLTAIRYEQQLPNKVVQDNFLATLYANTPYAHSIHGSEQTIQAITPENLKAFYQQYYSAKNAVLSIVGDLSLNDAKTIAEKISASLQTGIQQPFPAESAVKSQPSKQVIAFPSEQTHIILGNLGITENNPDYFKLIVGNYILGGGTLVSRLNEEVREKQGLSYTISSDFLAAPFKGPFSIYLQTANTQASKALSITQQVLTKFIAQGPTEAELESAKAFLVGSFPLRLDNNSKLLDNIAYIGFYNLPLNYLDTYVDAIKQVNADQVRQAFQKQFTNNPLITIIVGNIDAKNPEAKHQPS